ncbi:MAG TPA: hypothetical protein EYP85_17470 [Armatimonadetes bacterium]|nr:hypothetical protein [Armatimonadota bacterium]
MYRPSGATRPRDEPERPLTLRAVVLGLLVVVGFTVAGCFSVFLRYEIIGTGYLPRGAVTVLLALIFANAGVRWLARRFRLTRTELLLIFCMLLAMAAIPGQEYAQHVYLDIAGLVYYADGTIAPPRLYMQHVPPWLVPDTDREAPVIKRFFEGLREGDPVPYRGWLVPLVIWTPYYLALYWTIVCLAALLARHWEEREKLLYPLMQVPRDLVETEGERMSPLLKNKLMWGCFAFSCLLYILRGLHSYYPAVPDINLQRTTEQLFPSGPAAVAFNRRPLHFYPEMVGIAYLLTAEVGFSLWFFYFLRLIETYIRAMFSLTPTDAPFFQFQTAGGYIVLALAVLYTARAHLADLLWATFTRRRVKEGNNPLAYRTAVLGFLGGLIFIWVWCHSIGISLTWAVVMFLLFPLVTLVVARVVCEAGMFIYSSPFRLNELLFEVIGTPTLGPRNVTLMTAVSWIQIRSTATQSLPYQLEAFKLAAETNLKRRQLTWAMLAAIVAAVLTCHVTSLYVVYHAGLGKLSWWASGAARHTVRKLVGYLENPTEMTGEDWFALGLGGALTLFLVFMRLRFIWWPLTPLGFVAWYGWPIDRYALSIFLGWLIKVLVLRFGGFRVFQRLRPGAFGLILGICFILTFWMVFHFFVPGPPLIIE